MDPTDETAGSGAAAALAPVPWREIIRWALVGTALLLVVVVADVHRHGGDNPVSLIQPGTKGPSTQAISHDFPDLEQPDGLGLDGQIYYAIARDPVHLTETADQLDAPRYRLQRPLLSWAAWALQPTGGGVGLILALFLVGVAGTLLGALATGVLSTTYRGPPWLAVLFPILPGGYWSLRVTVSDALALGLALGALAFAARHRHGPAVAIGVLAVLAKEPVLLVFLGWALHRRTRKDLLLLVIPGVVYASWMGGLHLLVPAGVGRPSDLGLPFVGLVDAWSDVWSHGRQLVGMACTLGGIAIGVFTLAVRGLRHPFGWAIAIQLGFLSIMGVNPTSVNFGATRMSMAVMILSALALATRDACEPGGADEPATVRSRHMAVATPVG